MEILEIHTHEVYHKDIDYVRYSSDIWKQYYGESLEPIFNDELVEELETEFQKHMRG